MILLSTRIDKDLWCSYCEKPLDPDKLSMWQQSPVLWQMWFIVQAIDLRETLTSTANSSDGQTSKRVASVFWKWNRAEQNWRKNDQKQMTCEKITTCSWTVSASRPLSGSVETRKYASSPI